MWMLVAVYEAGSGMFNSPPVPHLSKAMRTWPAPDRADLGACRLPNSAERSQGVD